MACLSPVSPCLFFYREKRQWHGIGNLGRHGIGIGMGQAWQGQETHCGSMAWHGIYGERRGGGNLPFPMYMPSFSVYMMPVKRTCLYSTLLHTYIQKKMGRRVAGSLGHLSLSLHHCLKHLKKKAAGTWRRRALNQKNKEEGISKTWLTQTFSCMCLILSGSDWRARRRQAWLL